MLILTSLGSAIGRHARRYSRALKMRISASLDFIACYRHLRRHELRRAAQWFDDFLLMTPSASTKARFRPTIVASDAAERYQDIEHFSAASFRPDALLKRFTFRCYITLILITYTRVSTLFSRGHWRRPSAGFIIYHVLFAVGLSLA